MQVLQQSLQMLQDLLEDLHVRLDVTFKLADFSFLSEDFLCSLGLTLQTLRKGLDLSILILKHINLFIDVHPQCIQLIDMLLPFFK